jgi:asparagine synthase (glutamine-hydrolysing)
VFARVLPGYFESDARAGIALTGGLDTRMIMACLPRTASPPVCDTYAGVTGETRDARVAARVAAACGLEHGLLRIGPDFFSNFGEWLERTVYVTDGCFGALGTHEVYLNALARVKSPLRVTGVFGSEILRGVSTFKAAPFSRELVQSSVVRSDSVSDRAAAWERMNPVTFAAFCEIPWNIQPSLVACRSQVVFRTPFLDNAIVALAYRVPASLRRSSRTAIRFVERQSPRLAAIPTDRGYLGNGSALARPVRRALAEVTFKLDYYQNEGMPQPLTRFEPCLQAVNRVLPVFGQHKYLHYRRWFRQELADYLRTVSGEIVTSGSSLWNAREVRRMAEEHIGGARNRIHDIGQVLTLRAIERRLLQMKP